MAQSSDDVSMAPFWRFRERRLGVRDAQYGNRHQAHPGAAAAEGQHRRQEGLLRPGALQGFKATMHEANFELIEIPTCASPARTRPTSAWWSTRWTSATPRRTSTPSSSSAATRTSRRWCPSCARTPRPVIGVGQELHVRPADRQLRRIHLLRRPTGFALRQPAWTRAQARGPIELGRDDKGGPFVTQACAPARRGTRLRWRRWP